MRLVGELGARGLRANASIAVCGMVACVPLIAFSAGCGGGVADASQPQQPPPPPFDLQATSSEDAGPDALAIASRELGDWTETIAALQADVSGQGKTVHIVVAHGDGAPLPCDAYSLVLQAPANAAFDLGHCEGGATPLTLVHRSALFAHDGPLPQPLEVGIVAREVRSTTITSGPPARPIDVICGIALKPSVVNMETGVRVSLLPNRYTLHVRAEGDVADVSVAPTSDGWQVHGGGALAVDYEVTDTVTGKMILQDHANLTCGEGPVDAEVRAEMPFGPAETNAGHTSSRAGSCAEMQLQELLAEKQRLETREPPEITHLCARCRADCPSRSTTTTTIRPAAAPNEGAYIATAAFGWTLIGGSAAMFAGGIASIVESSNMSTTPSSAPRTASSIARDQSSRDSIVTRGVILVDIAPHVLTTGIVMLAMNVSANRRALKAKAAAAALSWQPFVAPVSGGAFAGVGHSF